MAKIEYKLVATFRSKSCPGKQYEVKVNPNTGLVSCNCPSWIYSKERDCKHAKSVAQMYSLLLYKDLKKEVKTNE